MLKICIYIGINAHVTPVHAQTDTHGKVEQYSAEAESATFYHLLQVLLLAGILNKDHQAMTMTAQKCA